MSDIEVEEDKPAKIDKVLVLKVEDYQDPEEFMESFKAVYPEAEAKLVDMEYAPGKMIEEDLEHYQQELATRLPKMFRFHYKGYIVTMDFRDGGKLRFQIQAQDDQNPSENWLRHIAFVDSLQAARERIDKILDARLTFKPFKVYADASKYGSSNVLSLVSVNSIRKDKDGFNGTVVGKKRNRWQGGIQDEKIRIRPKMGTYYAVTPENTAIVNQIKEKDNQIAMLAKEIRDLKATMTEETRLKALAAEFGLEE